MLPFFSLEQHRLTPSKQVLDFNLPASDHGTLKLNGATILPLDHMTLAPLTVSQIPRDVTTIVYVLDRNKFPLVKIDDARLLTANPVAADGSKQYSLEVNILAVESKPVDVQGVRVALQQAPDGLLSFGTITPLPKGTFKDCGRSLKCLLEKMVAKMRKIKLPAWAGRKGCKGRKGHGSSIGQPADLPAVAQGLKDPAAGQSSKGRHHYHGHHGHHGHHGFRHGHRRPHRTLFNRIVAQVLLPIFIGIVAGITVSLVGLVIGHAFVALYRRFKGAAHERRCGGRRRGFFGRRRREQRERERLAALEADGEAEKGLLGSDGELDEETSAVAVESPPAYAADKAVEVVEKE